MANLLSKDPLLTAQGAAEVYVVYDGQDYRMTLATLITLVSKASVGLSNVNNTADADKPVSTAMSQALSQKANADSVPTLAAFNDLATSLQSYATQLQLNTAIQQITQALNSYTTSTQLAQAIDAAISPVTQGLDQLSQSLGTQISRINALEQNAGSYVSGLQLSTAINGVGTYVDQQVLGLTQQLQTVNQTIAALTEQLNTHTHAAGDIDGLTEFVTTIVQQSGTIVIGTNQW